MSKLYFKFGTMGSSKTANALMTRFNYEEKGKKVWLIKPAADVRDDSVDKDGNPITLIKSRIGLACVADVIMPDDNIFEMFTHKSINYDAVICDESQFLTEQQINELRDIVDICDVPVFCFGLRTDFLTHSFEGSRRLLEIADSISEIKSICKCGQKAVVNARFDENGKIVTSGDQICIGGNDKYASLCYKCWNKLVADSKNKED